MEKDIDKITKNQETDIVIRIDDFGGKRGLTIREFVKSERYTGFTKAGTRIPADQFKNFKAAINSIDENDLIQSQEEPTQTQETMEDQTTTEQKEDSSPSKEEEIDEEAAI